MSKISSFLDKKIVNEETAGKSYLTWRETIAYAIGRGAQGLSTSMMSSDNINTFTTKVMNIRSLKGGSSAESGSAVLANIRLWCGLWDAFNDPVMGVLVDKTHTKDGKMRPYIKYAPFICALFTCLLFFGSASFPNILKVIFTVIAMVGWDMSYTAFDIPMGALAFSITPNGIERTKLYSVSSIVRAVIGAIPQVLILAVGWIPALVEKPGPAYLIAAIIASAGMILFTRPTYKFTTERAEHSEDEPTLKHCFELLFKNKPLFMLFLANMAFLLVTVQSSIDSFVAIDLMGNYKYKTMLAVAVAPAPFAAGILTPIIVEKLGKKADFKKLYQLFCIIAAGISGLFFITCRSKLVNLDTENGSLSVFFVIIMALFIASSRIPLEIKNLLGKEMEAETVDYVEWKTGERAEGVMLSLMSFTGKLTNSVSSSIALFILRFAHYDQGSGDRGLLPIPQPSSARFALFACISLVPMIGYLIMLIPIHFYGISRQQHELMLAEIAQRRELDQTETSESEK